MKTTRLNSLCEEHFVLAKQNGWLKKSWQSPKAVNVSKNIDFPHAMVHMERLQGPLSLHFSGLLGTSLFLLHVFNPHKQQDFSIWVEDCTKLQLYTGDSGTCKPAHSPSGSDALFLPKVPPSVTRIASWGSD